MIEKYISILFKPWYLDLSLLTDAKPEAQLTQIYDRAVLVPGCLILYSKALKELLSDALQNKVYSEHLYWVVRIFTGLHIWRA